MTYEELVEIAVGQEDVVEVTSRGNHSVKRGERFMFWFNPKVEAVALKLDWELHDELIEATPDIFFKTDHYDGYPALLFEPEKVSDELGRRLVMASWSDAPNPAKKRSLGL